MATELAALNPAPMDEFRYYKENRNSKEVDFLINVNGKTIPIEVKSQATINRNNLSAMCDYLEKTKGKVGVLIYNGASATLKYRNKNILASPPFLMSKIPRLVS